MKNLILVLLMMAVLGVSLVSAECAEWTNSRQYNPDLSASDVHSNFYYSGGIDTRNPWILLCKNVGECTKNINLKEGENNLQTKIVDSFGIPEPKNTISVCVDSKKPVITKTLPSGLTTGNVEFEVQFVEENPESVTLHYGNYLGELKEDLVIDLASCSVVNKKYTCRASVDLSDFDGREISYWFTVEDKAGNIAGETSAKAKLGYFTVDSSEPVIEDSSYSLVGRSLNIAIEITESNFKRVSYIDNTDRVPRFKSLCSRLVNGRCTASIVLSKGEHSISFEVEDKAGNVATESWEERVS